jgi:hypothetical protein
MKSIPAFGFGALVLMALSACSVDRQERVSGVSPDHQLVAILIEASSGGAIGDTWYELNVNEKLYPRDLKHPVLIASHCEPPPFSWLDNHTIQVHYTLGCTISQFTNIWYKPSDLAHGTVAPIEIILVRHPTATESVSEIYKLYDPSSLAEVRTLRGFPKELQTVLGVQATGYQRLADVGEPCDPTDVVGGKEPGRCFLLGGASDSSAIVAFKVGGYAGQWAVGQRYVHTKSGWIKVGEGNIGYPKNLSELKDMDGLIVVNSSSIPK